MKLSKKSGALIYSRFPVYPLIPALLLSVAGIKPVYADITFDYDSSSNCFPFGSCPVNEMVEYQQLYSHYQFGSDPLEITGIRFKPEQGGSGAFASTPLSFTLTLSTTLTRVASIYGDYATQAPATSFAGNLGVNTVTVFSGPISLSSSGNDVFDITIPFITPYLYDPHAGNLLIGITDISGGIERMGLAAGGTSLMSRFVNGALGGTPNIFFQGSFGLATQFISTANPVPEPFPDGPPSTVPEPYIPAMLLAGLGLLFLKRGKKLD